MEVGGGGAIVRINVENLGQYLKLLNEARMERNGVSPDQQWMEQDNARCCGRWAIGLQQVVI